MFKNNKYNLLGLVLALLVFCTPLIYKAQCVSCGTVVTVNSAANVTVATGASLCIVAGVTYSGNITLNGGTLCNQGVVTSINFVMGTFNNYGSYNPSTGTVNINSGGNLIINNYSIINGKIFNFSTSLTTCNFNLNLFQGSKFSTNELNVNKGSFYLSSGVLTYINQPTYFSVNGAFRVSNSVLSFTNAANSIASVKYFNLQNKLNKTIINNGNITVSDSLKIDGNGENTSLTAINNYSIFTITRDLISSQTNGTVSIANSKNFSVAGQSKFTISNTNIANNGNFSTMGKFSIGKGAFTNNNTAKIGSLLSSSQTTVNNNGLINALSTYSNSGILNLRQGSLLKTVDYYNTSTGSIVGPATETNTANYAKIEIKGTSQNTGIVNGKIIIYDQSLTSNTNNANTGFDNVINPTNIASTVKFFTKAAPTGVGPIIPDCTFNIYSVVPTANLLTSSCNGSVNLSAQVGIFSYMYINTGPSFEVTNIPISSYVWQPGNITGQNCTVNPSVTTTYTVYATLPNGCVISNIITIVVTTPTNYIASAGGPDVLFPYPDFANLTGSVISGGVAPYTYAWAPNMFFSPAGNAINNPQVNPPIGLNYTLTVTDANGCKTTATVNVIPLPYAPLNIIPDGGYYKVVNNKLLFKFDGQYAQTGLNYRVLDKSNTVIASNSLGNIASSLVVNSGDNRYYLNVSSGSIASGYYTLEITNEKKEKLYLRFQK